VIFPVSVFCAWRSSVVEIRMPSMRSPFIYDSFGINMNIPKINQNISNISHKI
jgi:hypothetical protein